MASAEHYNDDDECGGSCRRGGGGGQERGAACGGPAEGSGGSVRGPSRAVVRGLHLGRCRPRFSCKSSNLLTILKFRFLSGMGMWFPEFRTKRIRNAVSELCVRRIQNVASEFSLSVREVQSFSLCGNSDGRGFM
jgi:hypothetical protein